MDYKYWASVIEKSVPGLVAQDEIEFLMQCVRSSPKECQCVDLGTYLGKSAAAICMACKGTPRDIITMDTFRYIGRLGPATPEMVEKNLKQLGLQANILVADSCKVPGVVGSVGLLFIDTAHNSRQLSAELDAWLPCMADGGNVVLHDYYRKRYPGYVDTINARFKECWELVRIQFTTIGFRKLC